MRTSIHPQFSRELDSSRLRFHRQQPTSIRDLPWAYTQPKPTVKECILSVVLVGIVLPLVLHFGFKALGL